VPYAFAGTVLHGVVERVATLAENRGYWDQRGVKEYETIVKVVDLPENSGLRPGMTAEVKILVNHLRDVLIVPIQAVAEKDGEHSSFGKCRLGRTTKSSLKSRRGFPKGNAWRWTHRLG
jgi:hypothetical protein